MESKNLQEIKLLREEIKRLKEINDIWLEGDIETLKEK